jgi:hypothetical protein
MPMKARVGQVQPLGDALIAQRLVPTRQSFLAIFDVLAAQNLIQRVTQRHLAWYEFSILDHQQRERTSGSNMIGVLLLLFEATFQSRGEEVGGV